MTEEQKKKETVALMLDSLNQDNRSLCLQAGMDPEEVERNIQQSQQSLDFMLSNIYDKLKEVNIIA
jgi:hypothetical protein